ncbi:GNAT family N-acetyltransferase [Roseomonas sp. BN140053]|uniref:GNAT family N-acetyltransferase n=1 Tax=Roseomonas sp. BN140053 TaxID=3391898 RepID=UPI0039EBFB00
MSALASTDAGITGHAILAERELTVRRPAHADLSALAAHLQEMQEHYGQPVTEGAALEAAALVCSLSDGPFEPRALVALLDDRLVGSAVLNVTFPAAELSRSLYIRDLYVARVGRRCGVGGALVKAAAALTVAQGFSALDWTTDATNDGARAMYERHGARQVNRVYYRMVGATLAVHGH